MLIGKPPFETSDVKTTYRRIRMNAYTFPDHIPISEAAKDTISKILTNDPAKRPSLDELLMHEFINNDGSIPRLLPASTLACPPSATYIRQFLSEDTTSKLKIRVINNEPKPVVEEDKDKDSSRPDSSRFKGPKVWVKKWVDYSSKYGLGYLLSNSSVGVFFNDSTKIVLDVDGHNFIYYERRASDKKDIGQNHTLKDYPKELQKKVTLLQHFRSYLEGNGKKDGEADTKNIGTERMIEEEDKVPEEEKKEELIEKKPMSEDTVYVKKWMRTRHAIMFRLSNKVVQVNFQDHTEIILSSESKVVTYVNKKGERLTYPLSTAMESSNMEMAKRLKYTKDILTHMLQSNQTNRNGNNRDLELPKKE